MDTTRTRTPFTLVGLLVLIAILGLASMLLMPAIGHNARQGGDWHAWRKCTSLAWR